MIGKDYKPQIDGLRALAVIPVIFFHAGFESFKGGFVGVDIFFVISGYLITKIIISDLNKNKFNIKEFYLRRARRILPALYFVTFTSSIASLFFLSEDQLVFFSKQIFSVIFFISNFFFWKNTGYFNPSSDLQPLLHTWSLGVEEQFYILFPIFLIVIWKLKPARPFLILSIISILSLILAQFGGNFKFQNLTLSYPFFKLPFELFWQAGSGDFYLPFGRAWELLAGSMVALYLDKKKKKEKKINEIISIFGFTLITISVVFFSEELQYPSIFTILPVLGTVLIIIFATESTYVSKFLSIKPLVFLGLISYSFYLWHQPLFAFNKIYYGLNLSFIHSLIIILFAFFLSILSWKYVETPFRNRKILNNKIVINLLIFSALIILVLAYLINSKTIKSNQAELPKNIEETFKIAEANKCFDVDYAHLKENKKWYCEIGMKNQKISYVVAGDSHALALKPGFHDSSVEKNLKGILVGFTGCPSLLNVHVVRPNQNIRNCKTLNDKLFEFIKTNEIKKIFLVSRWTYYTDGGYDDSVGFGMVSEEPTMFSNKNNSRLTIAKGLETTFKKYNDIDVEIFFINQVPLQLYDPRYAYLKSITKNKKVDNSKLYQFGINYDKHKKFQQFIDKNLNLLKSKNYKFTLLNFDNFLCKNLRCKIGSENGSYYSDVQHLSINGSKKLKSMINSYLD